MAVRTGYDVRILADDRVAGDLLVHVFATGLSYPTHMEFTPDGRLLVSERQAGRILDITRGGDFRGAKPLVEGLELPAAILPLGDRLLVAETGAGCVTDVTTGRRQVYATDLQHPYSLAALGPGESARVFVSELSGLLRGQSTEITGGGTRRDFRAHVTDIPYKTPIHYQRPGDPEILFDARFLPRPCLNAPWKIVLRLDGEEILVLEANHIIFKVPPEGGSFFEIIRDPTNVIATGLEMTGGMIQHPVDGKIYAANPAGGTIFAVDPRRPGDYRFEPPVLAGLWWPSCVRFSPDGEQMFVCSAPNGVVFRVTRA